LQEALYRYTYALMAQISQTVAARAAAKMNRRNGAPCMVYLIPACMNDCMN
jgi:hypothetical protein